MGQRVVQLRPLTGLDKGVAIRDGVVNGNAGEAITSVGHALKKNFEICNYTAGIESFKGLGSHVVINETDGKGGHCAARRAIGDEEAREIFAEIEARCKSLNKTRRKSIMSMI